MGQLLAINDSKMHTCRSKEKCQFPIRFSKVKKTRVYKKLGKYFCWDLNWTAGMQSCSHAVTIWIGHESWLFTWTTRMYCPFEIFPGLIFDSCRPSPSAFVFCGQLVSNAHAGMINAPAFIPAFTYGLLQSIHAVGSVKHSPACSSINTL